jgi:hypothetical protein
MEKCSCARRAGRMNAEGMPPRCFALKCAQVVENARVMIFGKHKCVQAYQKK